MSTTERGAPPEASAADDQTTPPSAAPPAPPRSPRVPKPRASKPRRVGLSIQSKLLIMLLGVSLVSSVIVGVIGFVSGRESLRAAAVDQLTTIRELRTGELERVFGGVQTGVTLDSRNLSAQNASIALNAAFEEAQSRPLSEAQRAELEAYYDDEFNAALSARAGGTYASGAFIPESVAGQYLQYEYTSKAYKFPGGELDFESAIAAGDPGDGSPWSAARERYHDYFQRIIDASGYDDVLLLDTEGNVVYTAYSGPDLGMNVMTGPFKDSRLAEAYRDVMATNSVNALATTDYERYMPSLNVPAIWVVSPVGNSERVTGALAVQIPIDVINDVLTGDERWKEQGLGDTGEVYVVGSDDLMRSNSRLLIEDPEAYEKLAVANGTPSDLAAREVEVGGTVLLQPVNTVSVKLAQQGKSGTTISRGYLGRDNITAYTPVDIDGLNWVAVARIDTEEAFAPVADFTRNLVISTLAILLAVSVLSMLLAQVFTRPVRRLSEAVRRVAGGDLTVQVPAGARDEFGDLGNAFNDMSSSLRIKQELIDEQRAENERLLHTLMPEAVAKRYQDGEETIAEVHQDVSVIFAELIGFDDFTAALSSDDELAQLNSLMRGFDEAAERTGVEKVRTLRGGYLASSGLIVPRVDNVRRAVEFANELRTVIARFNASNEASVELRAGIATGTVTSGLVGRTSLAYDLWGDAVNLAYRVRSVDGRPGIYVSQAVKDRLQDGVRIVSAGAIETADGTETVWRVE
ncbi:class 3 adenylate cyclase [Agromyces cerinus]|uniref:adenylate/guanylate cyclase domain-containing protein n=1 Tax=Agromyces cerinus TaxID=33878 RepID=UPI0019573BB6|nr:adenylate/guanylate cyclase domain-containing protein [Agromyces cerinus]MBM7831805.1 class 3 adenylate cyclase [Agromyces cerinus]